MVGGGGLFVRSENSWLVAAALVSDKVNAWNNEIGEMWLR
jgi:hypothetical protein